MKLDDWTAFRAAFAVWVIFVLALAVGIVCVGIHFIGKYW